MKSTKEFILNMHKDSRKWCRENYHLFVLGNGIEDEPSVGCEEMSKMHYNPHFNLKGKNQEHPNDSTVILDLFDAAASNEIYDPAKNIPGIFLLLKLTT